MKLPSLVPLRLRGLARKLRFARQNASFVPRVVSKTIDGVAFDFLLGDATGAEWYGEALGLSRELTFLRERMASPGDVVLECGAHHGFTTLLLANWIGPTGHVTAFEASPSSAKILQQNVARNHLEDRITVEAKAVGARAGSLSVTAESNAIALTGRHAGGVNVPTVPLDAYADLEPTLIKLDVEGFEVEALQGAARILRRRPKWAIEVHVDMLPRYRHRADDLFELIRPDDYELWLQLGADELPRPYARERLNDQHMDQVHLYAFPRG